jgi:hypothetical protein
MSTLALQAPRRPTARERVAGLALVAVLAGAGLIAGLNSVSQSPPVAPLPDSVALNPSTVPQAAALTQRRVLVGLERAPATTVLAAARTAPAPPQPQARRAPAPPPAAVQVAAQEEPPPTISAGDAATDAAAVVVTPLEVAEPPAADTLVTPVTPTRLR